MFGDAEFPGHYFFLKGLDKRKYMAYDCIDQAVQQYNSTKKAVFKLKSQSLGLSFKLLEKGALILEWDFDNDRPIYQQIVEHLELRIVCGEYEPGSKVPSVRELAGDAGVNPNTMQRALAELEHKGLLITQRTSGRFVTEDRELITNMRNDIAQKHTKLYMDTMRGLGYKNAEIIEIIRGSVQ